MTVMAHSVLGEVNSQIAAGVESTPIHDALSPVPSYREPAGPFVISKARRREVTRIQDKVMADASA